MKLCKLLLAYFITDPSINIVFYVEGYSENVQFYGHPDTH